MQFNFLQIFFRCLPIIEITSTLTRHYLYIDAAIVVAVAVAVVLITAAIVVVAAVVAAVAVVDTMIIIENLQEKAKPKCRLVNSLVTYRIRDEFGRELYF